MNQLKNIYHLKVNILYSKKYYHITYDYCCQQCFSNYAKCAIVFLLVILWLK